MHHGFFDFFCLTVPKNFVGEPSCVPKRTGNESFLAKEWAVHHGFLIVFCLTVPKKIVGGTLVVSETFGYGKKM